MATKVRENMHQAITDNKKRPSRAVFLFIVKLIYFPKAFLLKTIKIPTPVEIATSATLKIALKNVKCLPPHIGNQEGRFPSQIGK